MSICIKTPQPHSPIINGRCKFLAQSLRPCWMLGGIPPSITVWGVMFLMSHRERRNRLILFCVLHQKLCLRRGSSCSAFLRVRKEAYLLILHHQPLCQERGSPAACSIISVFSINLYSRKEAHLLRVPLKPCSRKQVRFYSMFLINYCVWKVDHLLSVPHQWFCPDKWPLVDRPIS